MPGLLLWEAELNPPNQCPGVLTSFLAESARLVEPKELDLAAHHSSDHAHDLSTSHELGEGLGGMGET